MAEDFVKRKKVILKINTTSYNVTTPEKLFIVGIKIVFIVLIIIYHYPIRIILSSHGNLCLAFPQVWFISIS